MPIFKSDEFLLNILPKKRILGIDPGTKTLGIAISNSDLTVASPIFTIQRKKLQSDLNQLLEVLKKYALENANFVVQNNSTARYKRELKLIISEITSHNL